MNGQNSNENNNIENGMGENQNQGQGQNQNMNNNSSRNNSPMEQARQNNQRGFNNNPYINQNSNQNMGQNPYYNDMNNMNNTEPSLLGSFYSNDFIKGALIGAVGAYLLTNENAQKTIFKGVVKGSEMFQAGIEEMKERFEDAKAEMDTER